MKWQSILILVTIFVMARPTVGDLMINMQGDDDGFGTGISVSPGDIVYGWTPSGWGPQDADGFDGYSWGTGANPDFEWTHSFVPFSQITWASLYMQTLDFPEGSGGELWLDGNLTSMKLPSVPLESGPHTVHGVTFDLTSYSSWLLDGLVTFGVNAHFDDGYSIDYALLTIEGTVVPVPSAVILGSLGLTFSGWLLKKKRMI